MRMAWMLAVLLMATGAMAQEQAVEEPVRRNGVALDVSGLLQGNVGVAAERAVASRMSVRLGVRAGWSAQWTRNPEAFWSPEGDVTSWDTRDTSLAFEPSARIFLTEHAPEGLWVGPQLGLRLGWSHDTLVVEREGVTMPGSYPVSRSLTASGGALVGYSAVLGKGVALQAAVGLALSHVRPLGAGHVASPSLGLRPVVVGTSQWDLRPVTQLSLGYAF